MVAASVETVAGQSTSTLNAGELALLNSSYSSLVPATATVEAGKIYYLAQGSYHTVDKIGPFHGGYKESIKSKGINPRFISKMWTNVAYAPVAGTATITTPSGEVFAGATATGGPEHVYLRVDIKGSPALRFLGRNSYFVADYTIDCGTGNTVAPANVFLVMAEQITSDPLVGPFVQAVVQTSPDGTTWTTVTTAVSTVSGSHLRARLVLTGAYVDTTFGDCSFQPTDFYEKEPVQIYLSEVDFSGNACGTGNFTIARTDAKQGNGFGETVLRDFILSNRYAQEDFKTDPRMREILNDIAFAGVSRTATYKQYNILHNIPRNYNPSGAHNSDQYLLTIYVNSTNSATITQMDNIMNKFAATAAAGVPVETIL
jgi:hypothetical protein